jgi:hypothetical protein
MKIVTQLAVLLVTVGLSLLFSHPANAQASRTWISGVGDDVNPCSRTAPCKTFAGAISKTAAGGEIDCLDPGGFGAVTITKSIVLDCGGGMGGQIGAILASGSNGVVINTPNATDKVTLRNLTINGFNGMGISGIRFVGGGSLTVEHVGIMGFGASGGSGIEFKPSAATTPALAGTNARLFVRDVEIQNGTGSAIFIAPANNITVTSQLDNVSATNNGGNSLLVQDGSAVTVTNSVFAGSGAKGVLAKSTAAAVDVNLEKVAITGSGGQGITSNGALAVVRISNNDIHGNNLGVQAIVGGAILSYGNNRISGNATDGTVTAVLNQQ